MKFNVRALCRIGGRDLNQDACEVYAGASRAAVVVCDGLGAYAGSEFASRIAVKTAVSEFVYRIERGEELNLNCAVACITAAHETVKREKQKFENCRSACTTICAAFAEGDRMMIATVGDTRAYQIRRGNIILQTRDDSLAQDAVEKGILRPSDVRFSEDQNQLTRAIGAGRLHNVHVLTPDVATGDRFVLCSDGFWELVYESELAAGAESVEQAILDWESLLLARAKKNYDNYTVAIIDVVSRY